MALALFPFQPALEGYDFEDDREITTTPIGPGSHEKRVLRSAKRMRTFRVPLVVEPAEQALVDAFFVARGYEAESFLYLDPYDQVRFGVSLGASIAAQVNFLVYAAVPAQGGDYPINEAASLILDDGTSVARTVDTDNQRFVITAPGAGSAMTASYRFYKRVRLLGTFRWQILGDGAAFGTQLTLREVPA